MTPGFRFERGRRYRLDILPAGARTKTVTREVNFLDVSLVFNTLVFDGRPESGTMMIDPSSILEAEDIGPAVWERS